jgi:ribonuclease P protein component
MIPQITAMSEYGYPKDARLLKRGDYLSLSRGGETCHKKHFLCIYKKGGGGRSRLGITVSKKVGKAVTRNRLKRMCREFYRHNKGRLESAWDIHIIARHSAGAAPRHAAMRSLDEIFKVIAEKRPSDNLC